MNKIKKWIKDIFLEVYVLTIWYKESADFETKIIKRVYNMKKIKKATPTHVIGLKLDGNMLEIKTVEPFDYQIEKIH